MDPETATEPSVRTAPIVAVTAAAVIVVDQLTKWWAVNALADRSIDLVWTLRFHLVFNSGMSFSLGDGRGPLIGVAVIAVLGVLIWFARSVGTRVGAVALGLVIGGAIGNLLDRVFREGEGFLGGRVVDFIDLQWWPVFNVADTGVVCGALLLLIVSGRRER